MSDNGDRPDDADEKPRKRGSSKQSTKPTSGKGKPWTFPKNTLEAAIAVAKAIEEKNAGNPMPSHDVARASGYKQSTDWRFLDLLQSASKYGLTTGTGATATIHLTKLGQDVVAPSTPSQRAEALLKAFRAVKEFEAVEQHYGGKRIPEDEFFLNTLTRDFNIPRDRVSHFAKVFIENLQFLRAFSPSVPQSDTAIIQGEGTVAPTPADKVPSPTISSEPRIREHLDTCFVMMPFGAWFDRYYQEIYAPAIRDAGYEPVRADELFTTGSVVEQIWDQIEKARVLLADLTGKNPNVFYELGLSHAARKPVVFTAAAVDDVPFDLRHLRVIIYEIREPEWAIRLKKSITDYLRNAAKEPEKSIPHPFRAMLEEADAPAAVGRKTARE
jgi:hypothetical protein